MQPVWPLRPIAVTSSSINQRRFLGGIFAPFFRASDRPIAMACFLLFTVPPLPPFPDFSVPFFFRRIALSTPLLAAFPYFLVPELDRFGIDLLQIRR
jgi:hypothetical protein